MALKPPRVNTSSTNHPPEVSVDGDNAVDAASTAAVIDADAAADIDAAVAVIDAAVAVIEADADASDADNADPGRGIKVRARIFKRPTACSTRQTP